jgi:micrococcal nuclease
VVKFDDGDTITVDMNGTTETIRFIGIDTPETHKPNAPVECYGKEASANTKTIIGNQRVRLEADPLNTNRDRYGRLLRYVYLPDGTLLEEKILSEGFGFAYTSFPFSKKTEFVKLESSAKNQKLGLWEQCEITVDSSGRKHTNPVD